MKARHTAPDTAAASGRAAPPEAAPRPPAPRGAAEAPEGGPGGPNLACDFCGRPSPHVRRVALDRGYERLRTPHAVRYACPDCSDRKERERRGAASP